MKLTRIIHPIGQGGFYSESLKDGKKEFTMIYDCGGNSKASIESYLENYFPKMENEPKQKQKKKNRNESPEKTIDAVFISHMHEDHVNGLDFLLNHFHVRYLILPDLNDNEILEVFLYNYFINKEESIGNSLMRELYLDNKGYYLNSRTKVYKIPHNNQDLGPYRDEDTDKPIQDIQVVFDENKDLELTNENDKETIFLSQGAKLFFNKKWLYIPFNPPYKSKKNISFSAFFKKQLNLRNISISELPSIIEKKGMKKCKKVYDDYFDSNHNAYSMTLFSGATNYHDFRVSPYDLLKKKEFSCIIFPPCFYGRYNPNCLYLGDFETKGYIDQLRSYYNPFWRTIASVQVPHHGSSYNHMPPLYEYARIGFISAGENNKYYHPNIDTLIGIKEMGCEPILVTEKLDTIKLFHTTDET